MAFFCASRYDTCPSYASVVDGRTQITDSVADVKYEGDAVEDPDEPRSNIEGEYIPPERDVVNCWEGFKRSPNSKTMVLTLGTFCSLISWAALSSTGTFVAVIIFGLFYLIEAFFVSRTFKCKCTLCRSACFSSHPSVPQIHYIGWPVPPPHSTSLLSSSLTPQAANLHRRIHLDCSVTVWQYLTVCECTPLL